MYVMIYITASNPEEAKYIGEEMVKARLAACANIIPKMSSVYWWEGEVERSDEAVLILKTKEEKMEAIIRRVKELHSYENPCVIAIPILKGSKEYLEWIDEETEKEET